MCTVIDIGTSCVRAGFAGYRRPKLQIPTFLAEASNYASSKRSNASPRQGLFHLQPVIELNRRKGVVLKSRRRIASSLSYLVGHEVTKVSADEELAKM